MTDVFPLARELAERGEPFVLATVVWRRAPSSGKEGSKAIIQADGRIRGWLGGACAEPAVIREAGRCLAERASRLMFLGPPEELAHRAREGIVTVPIACQSEGAIEVYLEPVLPAPHLVVVGRSPAVDALASMAAALGWRAVVVDDGGRKSDHPASVSVVTSLDLAAAGANDRSFIVVATQGHYDEAALQAALRVDAAYVGLVASRKRAETVLGYLRERGVPEGALAGVHAPAGLDLGPMGHEEIAVAVLAELVALRARGELGGGAAAVPAAKEEAIDPVCGMQVAMATSRHRTEHEGTTYHFCSAGCLAEFRSAPAHYTGAAT